MHFQSVASTAGDLWLESQTRTLDHIDEVTRRWIDAARESLDEMRECSNLGELMRLQQEWIMGSMRRAAMDVAEFGRMSMDLAQRATSQIERSTERTVGQASDPVGRSQAQPVLNLRWKPWNKRVTGAVPSARHTQLTATMPSGRRRAILRPISQTSITRHSGSSRNVVAACRIADTSSPHFTTASVTGHGRS
jgi:hypothetical protein